MIAPQDLRLGNYVKTLEGIFEIRTINQHYLTLSSGIISTYPAIEPIELTGEWLEKFGFDSNKVAYKIDNDRFVFELYFYDAWNLNYVEKPKFGNGSVELSGYWKVHELQNLFFALTGEELKIKES